MRTLYTFLVVLLIGSGAAVAQEVDPWPAELVGEWVGVLSHGNLQIPDDSTSLTFEASGKLLITSITVEPTLEGYDVGYRRTPGAWRMRRNATGTSIDLCLETEYSLYCNTWNGIGLIENPKWFMEQCHTDEYKRQNLTCIYFSYGNQILLRRAS